MHTTHSPKIDRHRRSSRIGLVPSSLLWLAAAPLAAGTLSWSGVPAPNLWIPPDETGGELADVPPVEHDAFSIFVLESGDYVLTSDPHPEEGFWPGLLALYGGGFDPARPLENLIAIDYYDGDAEPAARIEAHLIEGVVYRVVTGYAADGLDPNAYVNRLSGPGDIRRSACFPVGDEVDFTDGDIEGFALQKERFCVLAAWTTAQGSRGIGRRVPFRSDDSVLFSFFAPENWELQVKVLDGCAVNGHFWVFFSATSDVELELEVFGRGTGNIGNPLLERIYRNPQGHPADAVTDTAAFPCNEVVDQL